jgi:hypothetical protein
MLGFVEVRQAGILLYIVYTYIYSPVPVCRATLATWCSDRQQET